MTSFPIVIIVLPPAQNHAAAKPTNTRPLSPRLGGALELHEGAAEANLLTPVAR